MNIKRNVLLNPGPATTTDTVKMAQIVPDICPREKEFYEIMRGISTDLVKIVHGDPEEYAAVLFCGSGTINIDICLNSLLPSEKKILIVNNGAYSTRAAEICQYYGLAHIDLKLPIDRPADLNEIEKALSENDDIALVYTTHNETGTGLLNPISEIGKLAHKYGAVFVVDTTSTYAISYFTADDAVTLYNAIISEYGTNGYEKLFWDDVVDRHINEFNLTVLPVEDNQIVEIDTVDELKKFCGILGDNSYEG